LLVLQTPPASVEVVAPLAESLAQVAQPCLLGEGIEVRVLGLLDRPLERETGPLERLEVRLGLRARGLGSGELRVQPIDLLLEPCRLPGERREARPASASPSRAGRGRAAPP